MQIKARKKRIFIIKYICVKSLFIIISKTHHVDETSNVFNSKLKSIDDIVVISWFYAVKENSLIEKKEKNCKMRGNCLTLKR